MPTYEYLCGNCGKFEEIQSIKSSALTECPTCHGNVKRIISGGNGMIFKGSGFYQTDNRTADYKAKEKADKTPPASISGSDTSSSTKTPEKSVSSPAVKPADSPATKASSGGESSSKSVSGAETKA